MKERQVAVFAVVIGLVLTAGVTADDRPPRLAVGETVEVSGTWDTAGVFIADEVELLPKPRRPKMRGTLVGVDTLRHEVRLYGQSIRITPRTHFLSVQEERFSVAALRVGMRVEISCRIDSTGQWIARSLRHRGVKESDKIKGTISAVAGSRRTDTLSISGLPIVVGTDAEIYRTLGSILTGGAESSGKDTSDGKH